MFTIFSFFPTSNYLEIDVDISSSRAAGTIFGIVRSALTSLILDLAFVLEAQAQNELPEQILGGIRLFHVDIDTLVLSLPVV